MQSRREVVVLVEGPSDVAAVETLLRRSGLAAFVTVRPMGGVTNLRAALAEHGSRTPDVAVLGLCDADEVEFVLRVAADSGRAVTTVADLATAGFHTCTADLEDELIRALGPEEVVRLLDELGLAASFIRFQHQPAWRGRDLTASLRRFAGAGSGRKLLLARALAEALPLDQVPEPLAALLAQVAAAGAEPRTGAAADDRP